jgi:uncharacterized membrane protein
VSDNSQPPTTTTTQRNPDGNAVENAVLAEPIRKRVESELTPLLTPNNRDVPKILSRVSAIVLNVAQEYFHGPLPHPAHFERYESIVPGSANRILGMAEKEQLHRHSWEDRALKYEFNYSIAGLAAGFIVGIGLIVAGVWVTLTGHEAVGGLFVTASAVGMVTAFIKGREIFGDRNGKAKDAPEPSQAGNRPVAAQLKKKAR